MRASYWRAMLFFAMAFFLQAAHADQIVLANGDRLTGKVVSKANDTLAFETDYAGTIKIRWKDVVSVTTDAPVTVMSADGKLEKGRLQRTESGGLELVSEEGARGVRLTEMDHINPPPHVAGTGVTYSGRVSFLASASSGNTDDARLYGEADFRARAKAYSYGLDVRAEQKEESGETTAQNYYMGGRYNYVIDDERFAYVRSSLENDEFKDIRLRGTLGAGLGLNIFETRKSHLRVLGGLELVAVDRKDGVSESFPAFGWGVDYSQWFWADRFELFHDQKGFASLQDSENISLRSRTGVRIPLGSSLSANAQINFDYEGDPGPIRDKTDLQVLLGLGYDF